MSYKDKFTGLLVYINTNFVDNDEDITCKEFCNLMFSYFHDTSILDIVSIMQHIIRDEGSDDRSIKFAKLFLEYTLLVLMNKKKEHIKDKNIIDKQHDKLKVAWENVIFLC